MVLELLERKEDVIVLDNLSTGFSWAVSSKAKLVKGNVGDIELVERIIKEYGVSVIIHFSGSIIVQDSVANPLEYYQNNTVNTRSLIEAAVKNDVNYFVFSSSAAVYGIPNNEYAFEDAPLAPISPYGSSKLMSEIMLKDAALAHDLNFVALRYFNVAGADPMGRTGESSQQATHIIKVASQVALGKPEKLQIFGANYNTPDGTCIRDYVHVSDLVGAHLRAVDYLRAGGDSNILNCGYGKGYSVLEVVEAVKKVTNVDFAIEFAERRAGDPAILIAGADRIRQKLGWNPEFDNLDTIVAHAYAWEKTLIKYE
jgi:UDP-glucose 4-epimerase